MLVTRQTGNFLQPTRFCNKNASTIFHSWNKYWLGTCSDKWIIWRASVERRYGAAFFHVSQTAWTNLQRRGSSERCIKDTYYALKLRCFNALASVLFHVVIEYFEMLEQSFIEESLTSFNGYPEKTWTGRARIRHARTPRVYTGNVVRSGESRPHATSTDKWLRRVQRCYRQSNVLPEFLERLKESW